MKNEPVPLMLLALKSHLQLHKTQLLYHGKQYCVREINFPSYNMSCFVYFLCIQINISLFWKKNNHQFVTWRSVAG